MYSKAEIKHDRDSCINYDIGISLELTLSPFDSNVFHELLQEKNEKISKIAASLLHKEKE